MNDKDELKSSKHGLFEIHPFVEAYFRCDNGNSEKSKDLVKDRASVSSIARIVTWCIFFPMVALFVRPSRAANLPPPSSLYTQSANPPTSVNHFSNPLTSVDHSSNQLTSVDHSSNNSTVTRVPKEIFMTASQVLEEDELIRQKLRELRGIFRLGLRGGGGPFLANPHPIDMPSSSKSSSAIETRKAFPQGGKRMLASENTTKARRFPSLSPPSSTSRIGTGNLSIGVDHLSNQIFSVLRDTERDSSETRKDHIRNILIAESLPPTGEDRYYAHENLDRAQRITRNSFIFNENEQMKGKEEMNKIVNKVWKRFCDFEREYLRNPRDKSMYWQMKELEETARFEIAHRDYHLNNTFGSTLTAVITPRNTYGRGPLSFTAQTFDINYLSKEYKQLVGHDLSRYFNGCIEGKRANNTPPGKGEQCEEIANNTLVSFVDINDQRVKYGEAVGENPYREVKWIERDRELEYEGNHKNPAKWRFSRVDGCVLDMVRSRID